MPQCDWSAGNVGARAGLRLFNVFLMAISLIAMVQVEARAGTNPIQRENARPGNSEWMLTNPAVHREIEGYASLTSVNRGHQIGFYVHTQDHSYSLAIYRMGWYGGVGARLVRLDVSHAPLRLLTSVSSSKNQLLVWMIMGF